VPLRRPRATRGWTREHARRADLHPQPRPPHAGVRRARHARPGRTHDAAIADIDRLESINDGHGRATGDQVLREARTGWAQCRADTTGTATARRPRRGHVAGNKKAAATSGLESAWPGTCGQAQAWPQETCRPDMGQSVGWNAPENRKPASLRAFKA